MKNRFRFIMPRLAGATVVAGVATLVMSLVFKLLLGLTLLVGAATLITRAISRRRQQLGHDFMPGLGHRNAFANNSFWNNSIQPNTNYQTKKGTSIVPID